MRVAVIGVGSARHKTHCPGCLLAQDNPFAPERKLGEKLARGLSLFTAER
jgi:hypothetical protein